MMIKKLFNMIFPAKGKKVKIDENLAAYHKAIQRRIISKNMTYKNFLKFNHLFLIHEILYIYQEDFEYQYEYALLDGTLEENTSYLRFTRHPDFEKIINKYMLSKRKKNEFIDRIKPKFQGLYVRSKY